MEELQDAQMAQYELDKRVYELQQRAIKAERERQEGLAMMQWSLNIMDQGFTEGTNSWAQQQGIIPMPTKPATVDFSCMHKCLDKTNFTTDMKYKMCESRCK